MVAIVIHCNKKRSLLCKALHQMLPIKVVWLSKIKLLLIIVFCSKVKNTIKYYVCKSVECGYFAQFV